MRFTYENIPSCLLFASLNVWTRTTCMVFFFLQSLGLWILFRSIKVFSTAQIIFFQLFSSIPYYNLFTYKYSQINITWSLFNWNCFGTVIPTALIHCQLLPLGDSITVATVFHSAWCFLTAEAFQYFQGGICVIMI